MTARQFFNLVAELRRTQKEYFKTRDKNTLQQSKRLEKMVDDEIARVQTLLQARNCQDCLYCDGAYACDIRQDYIEHYFAQTCQDYKPKQKPI